MDNRLSAENTKTGANMVAPATDNNRGPPLLFDFASIVAWTAPIVGDGADPLAPFWANATSDSWAKPIDCGL